MRTQQTPALLLLVTLGFGCSAPSAPNASAQSPPGSRVREPEASAAVPESFVVALRFDEASTGGGLSFRLLAINDSRCPQGVQCVWEGQVVATVEVSRQGSASESAEKIELSLRPGQEPSASSTAGHELRLLSVEPYPKEGSTPSRGDQVATVELRTR